MTITQGQNDFIKYNIYFLNPARIWVTDQNEKFPAFFARILANLVNFDVKMFCPIDFDVKIARILIVAHP